MTVQFLAAWNGYEQYQVVNGLSAVEEARLVGLKVCQYYYPPPPVSGAGSTVRTTPVRYVLFGDSTRDPLAAIGTTQLDQSVYSTTFAAATALVQAPEKWQLPSHYSLAYLVGAAGKGGETTADMLARETAAASASRKSMSDCLDLSPDMIDIGAGVNDLKAGVPVATVYANICTLVRRAIAAHVPVILGGVYGQDAANDVADLASMRAAIVQLNALLAGYAATLPNRVFFLDPVGVLSDAGGAFLPGMVLQDGLGRHLTLMGQYKIDKKKADILRSVFGRPQGPRFPGRNLMRNAAVAAVNLGNNALLSSYNNSGGYGGFPTGWQVGVANGVRQNGRLEIIKDELYYVVENAATAAANYLDLYFPLDVANWTPVSGDTWGVEFRYAIGGVTNALPPTTTILSAEISVTFGNTISVRYATSNASALEADESGYFTGKVNLPPFKFPADTGPITAASVHFKVQTNDIVTWKLGLRGDRLVQLNAASDLTVQQFAPAVAGTVTVDCTKALSAVVTMPAGNITVAAPLNPQVGQELAFSFIQDAAGGRTITWNAVFKKAADGAGGAAGRGAVKYRYDGTNWVQTGGALAYF